MALEFGMLATSHCNLGWLLEIFKKMQSIDNYKQSITLQVLKILDDNNNILSMYICYKST
jgi:hypothetical protein